MNFRNDIQGLRALAVLAVFFFHFNLNLLPGGFLGVDIFFVISGFLISGILLRKKENQQFSFWEFYQSRFKRIIPAYFLMLLVISIFTLFIYFNQDIKVFRKTLFWSTLFNSNNYFATLDTYFGAKNSENPLLHTWTLAVEMQFYFILPIFIWLFRKKTLHYLIIILLIGSVIYTHYQISIKKEVVAMYYSLPARSGEFLIGVLVQFISFKRKSLFQGLKENLIGVLGLVLILIPLFTYDEKTTFPGILAIIPCVGTGLLLLTPNSFINNIFSKKFFVFIGGLSYSIYLWHWPFMALYRYYYSQYEIPFLHGVILSFLIFGFSYFSYTYVEEYFRKRSNNTLWISTVPALGAIGLFTLTCVPINEKLGIVDPIYSSSNAMGLDSHGKYFEQIAVLGDPTAKDTIFMLGDSHGLVMKPFFNYIGKRNKICFTSITNDTYPPLPGINPQQFKERSDYKIYKPLADLALSEIQKRKTVIIIKSWGRELPYFNESLIELFRSNPNKNFILLEDFPTLSKNPIRINRGFIRKSNPTEIEVIERKIPVQLTTQLKEYSNLFILDLTKSDLFEQTPYYRDTVFYYDQDHLNKYGSEKYAEINEDKFMNFIKKLSL